MAFTVSRDMWKGLEGKALFDHLEDLRLYFYTKQWHAESRMAPMAPRSEVCELSAFTV